MCHTWKLKKVDILPFSGLIYPLMGRTIKIPALCIFVFLCDENIHVWWELSGIKIVGGVWKSMKSPIHPEKGWWGKKQKPGFLHFLICIRRAHSSNYNFPLLKLKEEFEKMFQVQNHLFTPKMGWTGATISSPRCITTTYND